MLDIKEVINRDPEIFGGEPVFANTRLPVKFLFMHLRKGITLDEFLEDFPTVSRTQAEAAIELAELHIDDWYESAA